MDKYISKSGSHRGLDLIANYNTSDIKEDIRHIQNTHDYNDILLNFKQIISSKINKFDPTKIRDTYDSFLLYSWYHYIIGSRSKTNIAELYKLLDISNMSNIPNTSSLLDLPNIQDIRDIPENIGSLSND